MVIIIINLLSIPLPAKNNGRRSRLVWGRLVWSTSVGKCSQDQYLLGSGGSKIGQEENCSGADPIGSPAAGVTLQLPLTGARGLGLTPCISRSLDKTRLLPGRQHHLEQDGLLRLRGLPCQPSAHPDSGEACALVFLNLSLPSIIQGVICYFNSQFHSHSPQKSFTLMPK